MAEFSTHNPGTFTWPELVTTDQKAGVTFYRALFGWDVHENPMGPTETYSLFRMRGVDVALGGPCPPRTGRRPCRHTGIPMWP